jgi:trimeric autotransporter adhesin
MQRAMRAPNWARLVVWSLVLGAFVVGVAGETILASPSVGEISTVAGDGNPGFSGDSGPAISASLTFPNAVVLDSQDNLFIADYGNSRVRRVDAITDVISTVAGNGISLFSGDDGQAVDASLRGPASVAFDGQGNMFIADSADRRIRRVDAISGVITTVAGNGNFDFSGDGGQATAASFRLPSSIAVDGQGNLFIADRDSSRIRRVDASSGIIMTIVGNGISGFSGDAGLATDASLNLPWGIVLDSHGNLFIADTDNRRVRRVDASSGIITTVAGDGTAGFSGDGSSATAASLSYPQGLALDGQGNLFIADRDSQRIRRVDATTGIISTVAGDGSIGSTGDGGPATSASFNFPVDIALDSQGNLLIADNTNHLVRRVEAIGLAAPAPLPALGPWVLAALAVAMAGLMLWRQVGARSASS